ncbi:hypothetical protein EVAR_38736_1 [Eumeta japonica]|uniref:Uncharacterized protein n=1 Tax=Eumeta variegata TaxID=151549 RepID=A0A4C1YRV3_EUMVA|nr:hypothetical protein EVAR_38736_1 [Eumeta japonica]
MHFSLNIVTRIGKFYEARIMIGQHWRVERLIPCISAASPPPPPAGFRRASADPAAQKPHCALSSYLIALSYFSRPAIDEANNDRLIIQLRGIPIAH